MSTFDLENPTPKSGDELRDTAANLLSSRFGRAIREHRADGKKVDVFFTRRDFGKETRVYVEAKDYAAPLRRSEVVHIWSDYSGIIGKNRPSMLLLITRAGLSTDAQAFVGDEQPEMRHLTIWELENETLRLAEYVRELSSLFDENGLSSYYVNGRGRQASYPTPDGRELAGNSVDIFEELLTWVDDDADQRPVAVLGGYGAGKSSLALRLISHFAQRALNDPKARRPVLIKLGELARYSSLEGLLGGLFTHDHPVDGFNTRNFLSFNEKGRLLIVLDGFDEMKHAMTWADFRSQIADMNRLTVGKAKVLLLGRPSAFTSTEEHVHVLRGVRRWSDGWLRLPDWPEFLEFELDEFTAVERATFFTGYLRYLAANGSHGSDLTESWIAERVAQVTRLADLEPELFAKPVHAKILVDLASDPKIDLSRFSSGITRWSLYEFFFGSLAEREVEKSARRPIGEEQRLDFLREVAFWLWTERGGATAFSAADLPDTLIGSLAHGEAPDLDALKREYLTGSFLEKKTGDTYYFGHRSFAEYLVAERMVRKSPGPAEQAVYSSLVRDGVLVFLLEAPDRERFRAWVDDLSSAHGTIHIEYLAFLADVLGGASALCEALPTTSIWLPLLQLFNEEVVLDTLTTASILEAMQTDQDVLFFALLSLLQVRAAQLGGDRRQWAVIVAGVILDRLFRRATLDKVARKAAVEAEGNAARILACSTVPEVRTRFGDRFVFFKGSRLIELKAEALRRAGFDIGVHAPVALLNLAEDFELDLVSVLAAMSNEASLVARAFFERSDSLRDVFTRNVKPPSRANPNKSI